MNKHKFFEMAKKAYYNTSFTPERKAVAECSYFDAIMDEFNRLGVGEKEKIKFERLFKLSLLAKSRCIYSHIVGFANFPIDRAARAKKRQSNINDKMLDYVEFVRKLNK